MKKLYMYIIIIFSIMILPLSVHASAITPQSNIIIAFDNDVQHTYSMRSYSRQNIQFWTDNSTHTLARINGFYALANNQVSGTYFSFMLDYPNTIQSVTANIQTSDGNFVSCNVNSYSNSNSNFALATCDLTNIPSQIIYRYGFHFYNAYDNSSGINQLVSDFGISNLTYFTDYALYQQDISTVSQNIATYGQGTINEIHQQRIDEQNQNQIINNTDTSSNSNDFANTINNFSIPNNSHAFDILGGLQGFINGLSVSSSCRRLTIPIPFINQNLTLPCMTTDVYSVYFPEIVVIWQLIVRGLVYYYIIVNILRLIKETIDPFNFKLEVMDL